MAFDSFFPYPEYDWQATERWLEKKAAKGHRLIPGGNMPGIAAFEHTAPAKIRYRLIPREGKRLGKAADIPPPEEALELYKEMGWEYLSNRGPFYIFSSDDPNAPEPSTDPRVLAMALQPAVLYTLAETLLWSVFIFFQLSRIGVLETAVTRNAPFWLLIPLPLILAMGGRIAGWIRLFSQWLRCRGGEVPVSKRRLWLPDNIALACCLMLVLLFAHMGMGPTVAVPSEVYENYTRHEDCRWPFTVPGATVEQADAVSFRTFATEENWGYDGYIRMPDGSQDDIYIDYADFHSPLFARLYAWELQWHHRSDLILCRGTEVWRIRTGVTIENPESIFFSGKEE